MHAIGSGRARVDAALFDSAPVSFVHFFGKGLLGFVMRSMSRSRWEQSRGRTMYFILCPCRRICRGFTYLAQRMPSSRAGKTAFAEHVGKDAVVDFPNCGHLEIRKALSRTILCAVINFFDSHSGVETVALASSQSVSRCEFVRGLVLLFFILSR